MLFRFVISLYAFCKISARDLAILMYWIHQAGVRGEFQQYGLPPGLQTGKYQRHLDKYLPQPRARREYYEVVCPSTTKAGRREEETKLFVPPHDSLDREMRQRTFSSEEVAEIVDKATQWGSYYRQHPSVVAREASDPPVIPFALYMDGVRYTRQVGSGRAQTMLVFTATGQVAVVVTHRITYLSLRPPSMKTS